MSSEDISIPNCQGCAKAIEEGAVVAFGDSLFHVKCFICAKCGECVDNKTNLLLLDDGRPVCDNCSYNCAACQKVIRDEAIMTGDKAYHSECFKCISCKKTIDDLIFTQTSKGIYCTKCHDLRKAEKLRKKNKQTSEPAPTTTTNNNQSSSQVRQTEEKTRNNSASPPPLPTPVRSRSNSLKITINNSSTSTLNNSSSSSSNNITSTETPLQKESESFLTDLSSFSFFDNDSTDLANLSTSLGVNLSINLDTTTNDNTKLSRNTTVSRINRVSEILQSSLRTSSLKNVESKDEPTHTTSDVNKLQKELAESRARIKELETSYKTLQDASQQALNEFSQVKEDLAKESNTQQQQELVITSLLKKNGGVLSRKEIDRIAQLRLELERTCKEMINYRDKMAAAMDEKAKNASSFFSNYQKNFNAQIKSLTSERDLLQHQTKDLRKTRDEVMHEMVLLNSKNAELTTMNNDLSRRAIEKEEATVVVTSPQRHTPPPLSPSQSTDSSSLSVRSRPRKLSDASSIMVQVSSRNSFIKDQTPKLFSIKKKGSTMFGKFGGSSSNLNSKPKPEPSLSSSSLSVYNGASTTSKPSLYSNNSFNSSLQSLHFDGTSSLGKSFAKNNKSFMDSTSALQQTSSRHNENATGTSNHSFQPMSFLRPVKCGVCGDKIWGRSEYRCECCGFSSHSRCLSKVPQHCLLATSSQLELESSSSSVHNLSLYDSKPLPPNKKSVSDGSMFGFDLSERAKMENRSVPLIVEECIKAVEARGLDYEGIYRKSGGAAQIRAIQLAFDQGEKIDLCDEEEYNDIGSITSVLKQYFRELPNPLLTFEVYDTFINISSMNPDEKKTKAFSETLSQLPKAHLDTIVLLFNHLSKVYTRCDENRMTVKNLAMVFAPTLMRHSDPSRDFLDISYKNATIEYILLHTNELFNSSSSSSTKEA